MIKVLIFDLDDTLYRERSYVFGAFNSVAKYLSAKYSLNEEELNEKILEVFYRDGRGKIFDNICEVYHITEDIKKLVEIYRLSEPKLELYEDAREILEFCKAKSYKLGVLTDGLASVQWNKIKLLGIDKLVDEIIVSDDLGREYWKPHEKPYLEIMNKMGCSLNEAVYIGDNPNKDFVGARKLGLKTIRIIREEGDHMTTFLSDEFEADYNIKSLLEIKDILKSL